MKQYLKALQEYEKNNNRFDLLCQYMALKNSNLVKNYRDGAVNLPSFMLIKKLHTKYFELSSQDEELNNLFLNAIECSKLFYARTMTLIKLSNNKGENFELTFSKEAQPLGQRLIHLLVNIKFRIRIVRLKRQFKSKDEFSQIISKLSVITNPAICWVNNLIYKASLIQSTHHRLTKKLYHVTVITAILALILMNTLLPEHSSLSIIITTNALLCLLLGTAAVIMHPGGDFGKIDISGKNIVAYKYRVFFNNLSNKKIHNIFTMQHSHEPRHIQSQSIESSKCESIT